VLVAAEKTPLRTQTGFDLDTPYGLDELHRADTIVVRAFPSLVSTRRLRGCKARV
jgi:hypothetical protein